MLFWQNDQDVVFKIKISVDQDYMFTVEKEVINNSSIDIDIACKTNINRVFEELEKGMLIMHEGPVGVYHFVLYGKEAKNLDDPEHFF